MTIKIFTCHVRKIMLNEKKYLYLYNKKAHLYAGLSSKGIFFQGFKNQAFFSQIECTERLIPSPPFCFLSLFKDPLPKVLF